MRSAALLVFALAACGGRGSTSPDPTPTVRVGEEFTLGPGQTASVSEASWRVRFDAVTGDSRCPADVTCVWEGDATVRVVVTPGGQGPVTLELHTQQAAAREAKVGDLHLRLVRLAPAPRSAQPVPAGDYRATFVASRTPLTSPAPSP